MMCSGMSAFSIRSMRETSAVINANARHRVPVPVVEQLNYKC